MPKFEIGDKVAWSHQIAAQHAEGSILRADALPPATPVGEVVEHANAAATWFVVEFPEDCLAHPAVVEASGTHPDANRLVLTQDELVKVNDEPTPPRVYEAEDKDLRAEIIALKVRLGELGEETE